MLIIPYTRQIPLEADRAARGIEDRVKPVLIERYLGGDAKRYETEFVWHVLITQVPNIVMAAGDDFAGKTVLDLGCGSEFSYDTIAYPYKPWFCRALKVLGARPIGVDIAPMPGEEFERYERDLLHADSLRIIPDRSVDIANASALFDSPVLERIHGRKAWNLLEHLYKQLTRIVKIDGVFVYDPTGTR